MLTKRFVVSTFAVVVVFLGSGMVSAQTYPNKPIRMVTAGSGFGGNNYTGRQIAQGLTDLWGQPVVVENRPTIVAIETGAKAPPDGYTLLLAGTTTWVLPLMQKKPLWDPLRDFAPITSTTSQPNLLVVHPPLPAKSVKELIALAKAKPGELNYGSSLVGSPSHLAAELFKSMAGVNIVGINYKGNEAPTLALISGAVQMTLGSAGTVGPHVKTGRLRALAITSPTPSALFPGLPTVAATLPGYEAQSMNALFAPAKTPAAIVTRLNQEIVRFFNRPEVKERFISDEGTEPVPSTPQEIAATIKSEMSRLGKVIKDAGIKIE